MIYEFIVYPHEVCYRPHETIGHCYQHPDFITDYSDDFSFKDVAFGQGFSKVHKDEFDVLCSSDDDAISFVRMELKELCDSFIDSLGFGQYAFILHNKDTDDVGNCKKPHFHVLFFLNENEISVSIYDFYNMLGMFSYSHADFTKRGKTYQKFERCYPCQPHSRYNKYLDYMRSSRLRYLCHLDEHDKFVYSMSDVIASFDYCNDPDVLNASVLNPFALFLSFKNQNKLYDEVLWFEWLASARLNDNVRKQLQTIKTDIHRYYVSLFYRTSKSVRSYS